jgi:hypothetical protein
VGFHRGDGFQGILERLGGSSENLDVISLETLSHARSHLGHGRANIDLPSQQMTQKILKAH